MDFTSYSMWNMSTLSKEYQDKSKKPKKRILSLKEWSHKKFYKIKNARQRIVPTRSKKISPLVNRYWDKSKKRIFTLKGWSYKFFIKRKNAQGLILGPHASFQEPRYTNKKSPLFSASQFSKEQALSSLFQMNVKIFGLSINTYWLVDRKKSLCKNLWEIAQRLFQVL